MLSIVCKINSIIFFVSELKNKLDIFSFFIFIFLVLAINKIPTKLKPDNAIPSDSKIVLFLLPLSPIKKLYFLKLSISKSLIPL